MSDHVARSILLIGLGALTLAAGCDTEKVARLERQNKELQEKQTVAEYDLREKCSRDAKAWFNENWRRDKDTVLLDYTNHYSKAMNKCFILVEYHYSFGDNGSWMNDMTLWDVHENSKYGNFGESHMIFGIKTGLAPQDSVHTCEMLDKKCRTLQEFNGLVRSYLND